MGWCFEDWRARRSDLVLPSDGAPGTNYILMRIRTPKTRGRAAHHQAARVDAQDFVQLISKVFENLGRGEPLWPFSAGTLRKRFEALLRALSLPTALVSWRPTSFYFGQFAAGRSNALALPDGGLRTYQTKGQVVVLSDDGNLSARNFGC